MKNSFIGKIPKCFNSLTDDKIYWIGRYYLNHTSNETINKYSNYCDGDLSQIDLTQLFYLCYDNFTKQEWSYRVYRCKLNNRRRQQWKNRILKRKNYG